MTSQEHNVRIDQRARSEIVRAFPELAVGEIAFLGAGVDSAAFLVNDEWVFRFPKREAVAQALGREVALLPKLAGLLPVAIPRFVYVGHQTESGLLFAGYRIIRGEPLTADLIAAMPHADQERVLAKLAAFLGAVHSFPLAEATSAGVEELSTCTWVEACWSSGHSQVLPLLTPSNGAALAHMMERFLSDGRNFGNAPCLLYADFAPEHVLYDLDRRDVAGIIDWATWPLATPISICCTCARTTVRTSSVAY